MLPHTNAARPPTPLRASLDPPLRSLFPPKQSIDRLTRIPTDPDPTPIPQTQARPSQAAMAAPLEMAFRSQDDALAELVTSEERYVKTLSTFRTVRASHGIDRSVGRAGLG